MFDFRAIDSHESSGYMKNQGSSNGAVKSDSDFFSMILSHSEISSDREPAAELYKPEIPVEDYSNRAENRENYKSENKSSSEISERKYQRDESYEKLNTPHIETQSEKTGKAGEPEKKVNDKKIEKNESDGENELEAADASVKKALYNEIVDMLKAESSAAEISEEDISGIVESLLSADGIKEAIKNAREEFLLKGSFKDFNAALSYNLKKIPDKIIEEALNSRKGKGLKISLKADDVKKVLEKVLLHHSAEGKKEGVASKNSNNQRHGNAGDVRIETKALNGDKIKQALSEEESGTGKRSFNEKGDSKEGFGFGYQKSDYSGKG